MGTLRFALLGLLASTPQSGYDLARALDRQISPFWHARHSQIYPELAALESEGLLEHEDIAQDDRPDKKRYELTAAGQAALSAWVTSPLEQPTSRDELVLRAYSVGHGDRTAAITLFRDQERFHRERETTYRQVLERIDREHGGPPTDPASPRFGQYLALLRGVGFEHEYAMWCGTVADLLERRRPAASAPRRRRKPR